MSDETFFEATPRQGVATKSGLIVFDAGAPKMIPHAREHRRRFMVDADWPLAVGGPGLFARALQTAFRYDPEADDRVGVLQELFGALALSLAPWELDQPKAGLLYGPQNGGKSTLLELAAVLIPPGAVCSLNPAVFANRIEFTYSLPVLVGKQLNVSGELGPGVTLGEKFKEVITGDRQLARIPGQPPVLFRPRALHLYACNHLPGLARGLEGAMQRRVAPIPCERIIPEDERIIDLVRRIREEDMAGLLAFAVEGAQRLLARGRRYSEPSFIRRTLDAWGSAADPVMGWVDDCVELMDGGRMRVNEAYKSFVKHARDAGVREIPTRSDFKSRVASAGLRPLPNKIGGYYWLDGGRLIGAAKASGAIKS